MPEMKMKSSWLKRVVKWISAGVILLGALGVFVCLFFTFSPGEKILKRFVEKEFQTRFKQELTIRTLETNLLSRLQLENIDISVSIEDGKEKVLHAGTLRIRFHLLPILRRRISIEAIELDSLIVAVNRDSTGTLNLPTLPSSTSKESSPEPSPFAFLLNRASLGYANLEYRDATLLLAVSVHGLGAAVERRGNEYVCSVHIDSMGTMYQDMPLWVKDLELLGAGNERKISLDSLTLQVADLMLSGKGESVRSDTISTLYADFQLRGNPQHLVTLTRPYLPDNLIKVDGDLDIRLHVGGTFDHPTATVSMAFPVVEVSEIRIEDGRLEVKLKADLLQINEMSLAVFGGTVLGKGEVSLDSLTVPRLSLEGSGLNVARVWQTFYDEPSPYQGNVDMKMVASGPLHTPAAMDVSADLTMSRIQYQARTLPDVEIRFDLHDGLVSIESNHSLFTLTAEARMNDKRLESRFAADIQELAPLVGILNLRELTGALQIHGTMKGDWNAPEIDADLKGRNIRYQNFPVDILDAAIAYRDSEIIFSDVRFSGALESIDSMRVPFHLRGLKGGMAYEGSADGSVDDLRATLRADFREPGYNQYAFKRGFVNIRVQDRMVTLSSLNMENDSVRVEGRGNFSIPSMKGDCMLILISLVSVHQGRVDSMESITLEAAEGIGHIIGTLEGIFDLSNRDFFIVQCEGNRFDLNRISHVFPLAPEIEGLFRFHLDAAGNAVAPSAELTFAIEAPRYRMVEMDSIKGQINFADDRIHLLSLEVFSGGQYSTVEGEIDFARTEDGAYALPETSPVRGRAMGRAVDLRLFSPFIPEEIELTGMAVYDLQWDGTIAKPRVRGTLGIEDGLIVLGPQAPPIEGIQGAIALEDSVVKIDRITGFLREELFTIEGQVTASGWRHFIINAKLSLSDFGEIDGNGSLSSESIRFNASLRRFDLSVLRGFLSDIPPLGGMAVAEVSIEGSPRDPYIDGQLTVRGGTFQMLQVGDSLSNGTLKVRFNRNRVSVDSLYAEMGEGSILVQGYADHGRGAITDVQLDAQLDHLAVQRPKKFILNFETARLGYHKKNGYYHLDGDITLGETRFIQRFQPKDLLAFTKKVERPSPEVPEILKQTRFNVRLRESDRIWIDNNLARLRLRSELSFVGSPINPNLSGRLSLVEGYVLYLDRKFQVKRGVLDFTDPHRINPIIDLSAEANIKSYQTLMGTPYIITITVTGPLDEAVFDLSSDPPLDKSDILSLLTLGATRDQLTGGGDEESETSVASILQRRLEVLSSRRISGYASQKVGGLLGLDEMTVEGNLFDFGKNWGPQLLASKKISERVELIYTTTVGHMNEQSIRLDYLLSKYFSVEGQTDQRGRAGMDLKYRLKFK